MKVPLDRFEGMLIQNFFGIRNTFRKIRTNRFSRTHDSEPNTKRIVANLA